MGVSLMPEQKAIKNLQIPGVSPPSKSCSDPNCPWHGSLRVRGVLLEGIVEKFRAKGSAVVRHEYLYYERKYKRYEWRKTKKLVHVPECLDIKEGDKVVIGETKPLSKTIKFVILGKI
ncbi:archaeal ribosomal protein S17P [Caldisphaera lagunensis DSM 15908]|uniref:30S ribosomal protein S17 n=2 Tax=Caldisphaera lagunensis TaxID=200415 RepID=L0ADG0_CALLD|nr:archaeal ribosomal protein S17P [Caldisphaera lagunensis DSM 15908]